ncbi:MAG TPA: hypothetical protein VFZ49_00630, partial [Pyrinomonadaceae bacterium]
ALAALVNAPFQATVSENAARLDALTDNDKSFDIVITEAGGARVTIDQETGPAIGHTLTVGRVIPANVPRAAFMPTGLIGSIQQRALFKNFDTGDDRVDVFVCVNIVPAAVLGTATLSGHRVNINRAAVAMTRCSVLMTVRSVDSSNTFPFVFPHEFGHVAGETGHAQAALQQLMTPFTTATNAIDGPKRVRDGAVTYDLVPGDFNLIARIRAESAGLLENF